MRMYNHPMTMVTVGAPTKFLTSINVIIKFLLYVDTLRKMENLAI